jgi:hypothetical protein
MDEIREGSVMTSEQINTAIAEACGWKNADHPDVMKFKQGWTMPEEWCMDPNGVLRFNHNRPDYCNDLNAMHEAEKTLTEHQWDEYERVLRLVCDGCSYYEGAGKELLHATAAQRAEAFLRTLGKWEETK